MREAVLNTTLNNNTRSNPNNPLVISTLVCLLLLLDLSRNNRRAAKQTPWRPDAQHTQGEARQGSVQSPFASVWLCPAPSHLSQQPSAPSKLISSVNRHAFALALAPASRFPCRPEPPILVSNPRCLRRIPPTSASCPRLDQGKETGEPFSRLLAHALKESSACPLSLPPCPCATEAEGFAQKGRRNSKSVVRDNPQAYPESRLHFGPSLAGTLSRESCLRRLSSWAICSLGAHLRRQPRCITTTRPKRRTLRRLVF